MIKLSKQSHSGGVFFETEEVVECRCGDKEYCFEIDEASCLGAGGNAIVYKCNDRTTGEQFAIKIHLSINEHGLTRFKREVRILQLASHEQLMSSVASGTLEMSSQRYGKCQYPYVVMPMADGNLGKLYQHSNVRLTQEELLGQFRGLSAALAELHQSAIHRDIKPENILIRGTSWVLADYGLCKFVDSQEDDIDVTLQDEKIGPTYWMSPESMNRRLCSQDEITKASDVFQLAAVFWFAATRRHPTGIVTRDDWNGPSSMFDVLSASLSHNFQNRPADGAMFCQLIENAILES